HRPKRVSHFLAQSALRVPALKFVDRKVARNPEQPELHFGSRNHVAAGPDESQKAFLSKLLSHPASSGEALQKPAQRRVDLDKDRFKIQLFARHIGLSNIKQTRRSKVTADKCFLCIFRNPETRPRVKLLSRPESARPIQPEEKAQLMDTLT